MSDHPITFFAVRSKPDDLFICDDQGNGRLFASETIAHEAALVHNGEVFAMRPNVPAEHCAAIASETAMAWIAVSDPEKSRMVQDWIKAGFAAADRGSDLEDLRLSVGALSAAVRKVLDAVRTGSDVGPAHDGLALAYDTLMGHTPNISKDVQ